MKILTEQTGMGQKHICDPAADALMIMWGVQEKVSATQLRLNEQVGHHNPPGRGDHIFRTIADNF